MTAPYPKNVMDDSDTALEEPQWCNAIHGNHDEHQCHKKPGHDRNTDTLEEHKHECYCGVWW